LILRRSLQFGVLFFDKFAPSSCLLLVSAGYYFDFHIRGCNFPSVTRLANRLVATKTGRAQMATESKIETIS